MGQLIKLKAELIKPSQNFLKKGTVAFILDCYKNGVTDSLPPAPLVRKHPNNPDTYIAIDGHNLLAVNEFLEKESEVYLVTAANDFLSNPKGEESIAQRNKDLVEKYESCIQEANKYNCSFRTLIKDFFA